MSSRLIREEETPRAEPVPWREVAVESGSGSVEGMYGPRGPESERLERRLGEAHAAGVREGEAAGRAQAAAEMQPVVEKMGKSIAEIGGLRASLRRQAEQDLVRLALAIARRILRREMAVDPDALHGLVLGALEKLKASEILRVRVHPAQVALTGACLREAAAGLAVEVAADPTCEPGALIFETERGSLDASVESQLQEIERGLADSFRKRP